MRVNVPSYRENRTLYILIAIAFVLVAVRVAPQFVSLYQDRKSQLEILENELFVQRKIAAASNKIKKEYAELPAREKRYREKLFKGRTPEIVNSSMRNVLNSIAGENDIKIRSLGLPEFSRSGQWLLVTQSLTFESNQQQFILFLKSLKDSTYFLPVINVDIRPAAHDMLRCSLKVVGFSRIPDPEAEPV